MATLLLCLALQDTRVTLELRDVPLRDAAARALEPFGHTADLFRYAPDPSKRVSLSLRDAGYHETLDTLLKAADDLAPDPGLNSRAEQELLVADLTPSLRLIAERQSFTRKEVHLSLTLIGPPDGRVPSPRFEGGISGVPYPVEFLRWGEREGDSIRWSFRGLFPFQRAGEAFQLEGTLHMGDGRRIPVRTDPVILPPHPEFPDPAPTQGQVWAFLIGGLALSATLILGSLAVLQANLKRTKRSG